MGGQSFAASGRLAALPVQDLKDMSLVLLVGDPEYEPEVQRPPSPRLFRNPEMAAQARVDKETKAEKCAPAISARHVPLVVVSGRKADLCNLC